MTISFIRAIMLEETLQVWGIAMDKKKAPDPVRREVAYDLLSGFSEIGPPSEAINRERAKITPRRIVCPPGVFSRSAKSETKFRG